MAHSPPLRIVRFSGTALTYGVEVHKLEGVDVRITSREKTVADCFRAPASVTVRTVGEYT